MNANRTVFAATALAALLLPVVPLMAFVAVAVLLLPLIPLMVFQHCQAKEAGAP